jgi:hypothetical protein
MVGDDCPLVRCGQKLQEASKNLHNEGTSTGRGLLMLGPLTTIIIFCSYMALLFVVALSVERQIRVKGKSLANNPIVYSLSLAVYCTSWTFYGSVGKAVTSGPLFSPYIWGRPSALSSGGQSFVNLFALNLGIGSPA